jgi:hypothetical protein
MFHSCGSDTTIKATSRDSPPSNKKPSLLLRVSVALAEINLAAFRLARWISETHPWQEKI